MFRKIGLACLLLTVVILTACASGRTTRTDQMTLSDGRTFTCTLDIPQSWDGKYVMRRAGSATAFAYHAEPQHALFTLTALTLDEWADVQDDPGVFFIKQQDDAVFIYTIALENLYGGAQADEFQRMSGDVTAIIASLAVKVN